MAFVAHNTGLVARGRARRTRHAQNQDQAVACKVHVLGLLLDFEQSHVQLAGLGVGSVLR